MKKKYPITDHFDGKKFFNPGVEVDKSFSDLIKWSFNRSKNDWPSYVQNKFKPQLPNKINSGEVYVTLINHVTFLIQTEDFNLITDPVFANLLGPYNLMGPNRQRDPGMKIEELPVIDMVLVSHNHYDHMDIVSLEKIYKRDRPIFIVPLGNEKYMRDFGSDIQIYELDWYENKIVQSKKTKRDIKVWLTPAQHWSARGLHDRRDALWGGFVVESNQGRIFFVGDSGYPANESKNIFKEIKNRIGSMDLSFIPIGAYEPRWFMKGAHMNPEEAVMVHQDLESKNSIGMHFGTFRLTDEPYLDPEQKLNKAIEKYGLKNFVALENGQTKKYDLIK